MRGRAPLVVALVLLVGLAAVVLQRGRGSDTTSPFEDGGEPVPMAMVQAGTVAARPTVSLGNLCAPGGQSVTIRDVVPFGVTGSLRVDDFGVGDALDSTVVDVDCDTGEPESFAVQVGRRAGESAHADGFIVTYDIAGTVRRARLERPVTVCRQLSEC